MVHTYRNGWHIESVPIGYPHGDVWTSVMHPGAPATHDVYRWMEMLKEQERKKKVKKT